MNIIYHYFYTPIYILSVLIWIANDLYLKNFYANWLTGKLSDFTSLFVFPIFLAILIKSLDIFNYWRIKALFLFSLGFTIILFISINVNQAFNTAFTKFFWGERAKGYADFSDLICLISIPLSYLYFNKQYKNFNERLISKQALIKFKAIFMTLLLGFACLNTSRPQQPFRSDLETLIIFDLSRYGESADTIFFSEPSPQFSSASGLKTFFQWKYMGYYLGDNPNLANSADKCAESYYEKDFLWKYGGTFKGYKLYIYKKNDKTKNQYKNAIFLYSMFSPETIQELFLDLPSGDFLWLVTLVFENKSACKETEVEFFPENEVAIKVNGQIQSRKQQSRNLENVDTILGLAASAKDYTFNTYFKIENNLNQVDFKQPLHNSIFPANEDVTFSWDYQYHSIARSNVSTICETNTPEERKSLPGKFLGYNLEISKNVNFSN
ncbi:MAG: hypothetical protein KDK45_20000, partial [Leptospiraceae bacterium]|nr:hypothetical protein [Leptospiraceae bacterium]